MTVVYVDTNIFIDYVTDRRNEYGRNLGDLAWKFFSKVMNSDDIKMIISKKTLEELYGNLSDLGSIKVLFQMLEKNIISVSYSDEDFVDAEDVITQLGMDMTERNDALHALLAKKNNADYLVTRNIQHFMQFSHIIESKRPEEI